MSATHFVLSENWKNRLCEHKFAREVQKQIDEVNKEIRQITGELTENTEEPAENTEEPAEITEEPTGDEIIKCSSALQDLFHVGLLKKEVLKGDLCNDQLRDAVEPLKIREKALIVIYRDDGLHHCMAIYKCSDQSKQNANVEIFDAQIGKFWPRSGEDVAKFKTFRIFRIEESTKQHFREKCSVLLCRDERKCACLDLPAEQSNSYAHQLSCKEANLHVT